MMSELKHTTVLLNETVEALPLETGKIFVDCTLGGGGHSELLLSKSNARLIAIDKDEFAIAKTKERLKQYEDRITYVHDDYKNFRDILNSLGIDKVDGVIMDLGVSSFQLDDASRGFSYSQDAPIDMRMDRTSDFSAYNVVNEYDRDHLAKVIFEYGEEKFSYKIADAIIKNRPVERTLELAEIIKSAVPGFVKRQQHHPAKKTFQAIRIETNGELITLRETINDIIDFLDEDGRAAIISFHSLEDRIVKQTFATAQHPCICPPEFPICVCGRKPKGLVVTKKPIEPSAKELEENPRARSAKLRIFKKVMSEER